MCLICFSNQHSASVYTSNAKSKCGKPHHYLLHFEFKSSSDAALKNASASIANDADGKDSAKKDVAPKKVYTTTMVQRELEQELIVLPSAVVRFASGKAVGTIRVLIDGCSQATLISDRLVKKFRLQTHPLVDHR